MKRYENIDDALCQEMEKLDKKYAGEVEMTRQDLEEIRLLYSAMVKAQTYQAMQDEYDWDDDMDESGRRGSDGRMYSGRAYRRGRDVMGRFTSRDMMPGESGHYPMMPMYPGYNAGYRY